MVLVKIYQNSNCNMSVLTFSIFNRNHNLLMSLNEFKFTGLPIFNHKMMIKD